MSGRKFKPLGLGEERSNKPAELSAAARLASDFTKAVEEQWRSHGPQVLEAMRRESPTKFAELVARLVPQNVSVPTSPYATATSTRAIGRLLLQEQGIEEYFITESMVDDAIAAQEQFIHTLQLIVGKAEH